MSKLNKHTLTLEDTFSIVNTVTDACFDKDEEGNDVDFTPFCKLPSLQLAFCENYLELELEDNIEGETEEAKAKNAEIFERNFAKYMSIDINDYDFNRVQWEGILDSIEEQIKYRKQKLLNKDTQLISDYLTTLIQKEIEVQDLQKKVLEQTDKINNQFTKEEISHITDVFANVNKFSENPEYLKSVAKAIHEDKTIKAKTTTPQDHKKPSKPKAKKPVAKVEE